VKTYSKLPKNAKRYLSCLADMLEVKISMVSVGSDRKQIFKL